MKTNTGTDPELEELRDLERQLDRLAEKLARQRKRIIVNTHAGCIEYHNTAFPKLGWRLRIEDQI